MEVNKILKTEDAKVNFLKGLIRLSKIDGVKDEKEMAFFSQAALAMGLSEEAWKGVNSFWETDEPITISFGTTEEKMFFFVQAIQLCNIDESYDAVEKAEISVIADELGISDEAITKVEEWVAEGMAWNRRGDALLDLN